jgi:predicted amidohydrolase YtcJ
VAQLPSTVTLAKKHLLFGLADVSHGRQNAAGRMDPLQTVRSRPSAGTTDHLPLLDSVAPNNPVWVLESNGHIAYANSNAFAAAGVTDNNPIRIRAGMGGKTKSSRNT